MELSFLLMQQIAGMVLMGLCGYVLGRLGLVTREQSRVLSCVCVYLAAPCSLITSFSGKRDMEKLAGLGLCLLGAVLVNLLYFLLSALLSKGTRPLTREEQASVMYNNAGNLIMPMVQNVLGLEYVLYTSPYQLVQNILIWTYGQWLMGGGQKLNLKKILRTPALAGIAIGLVLFAAGITLPPVLQTAMSGLSGCMGPLSMLVIGILISDTDLKQVFLGRRIYWIAFLRLILYPLLVLPLILVLGRLFPLEDGINILTVLLLSSIGPAASTVTQQAQFFRNPNSGYVSSINVLTILLSAVTMPLILWVFLKLL